MLSSVSNNAENVLRKLRNEWQERKVRGMKSCVICTGSFWTLILDPKVGSPWNSVQGVLASLFSRTKILDLYQQFQEERHVNIGQDVVDSVMFETEGHRGLVVLAGRSIAESGLSVVTSADWSNAILPHFLNAIGGTRLFTNPDQKMQLLNQYFEIRTLYVWVASSGATGVSMIDISSRGLRELATHLVDLGLLRASETGHLFYLGAPIFRRLIHKFLRTPRVDLGVTPTLAPANVLSLGMSTCIPLLQDGFLNGMSKDRQSPPAKVPKEESYTSSMFFWLCHALGLSSVLPQHPLERMRIDFLIAFNPQQFTIVEFLCHEPLGSENEKGEYTKGSLLEHIDRVAKKCQGIFDRPGLRYDPASWVVNIELTDRHFLRKDIKDDRANVMHVFHSVNFVVDYVVVHPRKFQ
jgi:hypothetical protein